QDLSVRTPSGTVLLKDLNLVVPPGEPLLIRGPSGSGKTTLLRAIAGLWPYCDGTIIRPEHDTLFLSQKPYLPLGTLREALHYPQRTPGNGQPRPAAGIQHQEQAALASANHAPSNLDGLLGIDPDDLGAPQQSALLPHADETRGIDSATS